MALEGFGNRLRAVRQERGFTQKQLANLLGVTEQAVSKYERGNSYPDIVMLSGISEILDCSLDYLFQFEPSRRNLLKQDSIERKAEIRQKLLPDIISVKFSEKLVPIFVEESKQGFPHMNQLRQQIARDWGIIIPPIRVMDELSLQEGQFVIGIHGVPVYEEVVEEINENSLSDILGRLKSEIFQNVGRILNNQGIYCLVENLREKYPYVLESAVPEKITYTRLRQVILRLLSDGYTASPLILIIEAMEEHQEVTEVRELAKITEEYMGEGFLLEHWADKL